MLFERFGQYDQFVISLAHVLMCIDDLMSEAIIQANLTHFLLAVNTSYSHLARQLLLHIFKIGILPSYIHYSTTPARNLFRKKWP